MAGRDQAERGQLGTPRRPGFAAAAGTTTPAPARRQTEQHPRPAEGHRRRRRSWAIRNRARTRSSSVDTGEQVQPGRREIRDQGRLPLVGGGPQPLLETGVVGVDEDHFTGLGVLDVDHPGGRQVELAPVHHLDGHHVVAAGELAEQALPARLAEEVGDDHDQGPAAQRSRAPLAAATARSVVPPAPCGRSASGVGSSRDQDAQHLVAPVTRRDRRPHPRVEEQRADPVTAAGQQLRHRGGDLGEHDVLAPLHRAEVHRRRACRAAARR